MKNLAQLNEPIKIYAATSKDPENTKRAASGGVFYELAKQTIKNGGVVFGSVLEKDGSCYHKAASTIEKLIPMQGSKYVRSSIKKTYFECLNLLERNIKVLYTGTPCQINDLLSFLKNRNLSKQQMEKLITVDLFCYGTPPQKLFKLYIKWLNEKHNTDDGIHNYTFRSKIKGWGPNIYHYYLYKNGKKIEKSGYAYKDPYYSAFLESSILQEKCFSCRYIRKQRVSDISIGDFWGINNIHKDYYHTYHKKGISGILLNTNKGIKFFNTIKDEFNISKSNYSNIKQFAIGQKECPKNRDIKLYTNKRKQIKTAVMNKDYNTLYNSILKVKFQPNKSAKRAIKKIIPDNIKQDIKNIINKG